MFESHDVAYCGSCGKEFEKPSQTWELCPDCFLDPIPIRKSYEKEITKIRVTAHKDKKWLLEVLELPYLERLGKAWRNGHQISYPPENE